LITTKKFVLGIALSTLSIACSKDGDDPIDTGTPNTPPSISGVLITPDEIYESSTVSCEAEGWEDPDGDEPLYELVWTVNDVEVSTEPNIDGADFNKGDTLACTITPLDSVEAGESLTSTAIVQNSLPTGESAVIEPDSASVKDSLSVLVTGEADDDLDAVTWTNEWFVNDSSLGTSPNLSGDLLVRGDTVYAITTPNDGEADGQAITTESIEIGNATPDITEVSIYPSEAYTNDLLSAIVTGEDVDGDEVTYTYAWTVDGTVVAETATLDGSTFFDKDQVVQVTVTPTDGIDTGKPAVSESVTILNSAPTRPTVAISPSLPHGGQDDLVCDLTGVSEDADGDSITYTGAWQLGSGAWSSTTTTTHPDDTVDGGYTSEAEVWSCTLTPNDGTEDGEAGSDSVTIQAPLPTLELDGSSDILSAGTYTYYEVSLKNGATLTIDGLVEIEVSRSFSVDSTSIVDGDGGGDFSDSGSGTGTSGSGSGAGGAGYGGDGGSGGYDSSDTRGLGGSTYGSDTTESIEQGSGGASSDYEAGGAGGAGLAVWAEEIDIAGLISMNGETPAGGHGRNGGGGSGGGILLVGDIVDISGTLATIGGNGGSGNDTYNDGGGAGGGGRIKVFYDTSLTVNGDYDVSGGTGGVYGDAGHGEDGQDGTTTETNQTYP